MDKYIVDFYCPELKLVIEIDGWQHKEEFSGKKEDIRTQYLKDKGMTILRFWNNDVNNDINNVILEIEKFISNMNNNTTFAPLKGKMSKGQKGL